MLTVDLTEIQQVVGRYVDQYNLVVAGGPLAAAVVIKTCITSNKAVNLAVSASGAWFAIKELSGPMMHLMEGQFGNLQDFFSAFHH